MIADLKPYSEYKPSAQAWLGDVPEHWSVLPNRALFSEVIELNYPDEEMLSITIERGIVRQKALLAESTKKDSSKLDKSNISSSAQATSVTTRCGRGRGP
jgi:type I restriction enzyme S subunit